ncbi:MAG: S8 family serine peptidase [Gemmatimonadales bacterium]
MTSRRYEEQLEAIKAELKTPVAAGSAGTGPADPPCAFQRGTVLVAEEHADWLCESGDSPLRTLRARRAAGSAGGSGLVRVRVGTATHEDLMRVPAMEPDLDVRAALGSLRYDVAGRGAMTASPNHLIGITNGTVCPADEPWPTQDSPSIRGVTLAPAAHRRPRVLVIDTGLVAAYKTLDLGDGVGGHKRAQETEVDQDHHRTDLIREHVGHGTFITALLKAVAPTADVFVSNALPKLGAAFEDEFGDHLFTAIAQFQETLPPDEREMWPDIISLSAGTTLYYDPQNPPSEHDQGLLALKTFMETLKEKPTLLVAAAGNNGNSIRLHPAALAERHEFSQAVVSVGALRENPDDGRACFSDFGPWVKAFAPGERLVADFSAAARRLQYQHATFDQCQFLPPSDNYRCACQAPAHDGALSHDPHTPLAEGRIADFRTTHRARWSGTSFATPVVAGYIAQRMAVENRADARGVYAHMRENAPRINVAGETALKVVPEGFAVQPMDLGPQ